MSTEFIELPEGFSYEYPSYNLVLNISPFPSFKCFEVAVQPYDAGQNRIWIKITPNLFGLYDRSVFTQVRCPVCGKPLGGD